MVTKLFLVYLNLCICPFVPVLGTFSAERKLSFRIVNGEICNVTKYPFVVALNILETDGQYYICGGSLITYEWVLTAAHCLARAVDVTVMSGFHWPDSYVQSRKMIDFTYHERFHINKANTYHQELRYDIGLIQLDRPFQKSATCKPVDLAKPGFSRNCQKGKALGVGHQNVVYGDLANYKGISQRDPLRCVDLHIVDKKTCAKTWYKAVIDETVICTMERVEAKDACKGDSGGPLLCNGTKILIGVISMGLGCGVAGRAATHTKVESYLTFISNVTKIKFDGVTPRDQTSKAVGREIWTVPCVIALLILLF